MIFFFDLLALENSFSFDKIGKNSFDVLLALAMLILCDDGRMNENEIWNENSFDVLLSFPLLA
jgi:hypothetical protein